MLLTKKNSNLIKRINKYNKILKTLIPFVQSSSQNRTDLGRLGGLDKGFTVIENILIIESKVSIEAIILY